jgi:amino acid adenylation domain-containing protein
MPEYELTGSEVAVIGMALRFPGADTPEELWENLKNGVESIRSFTDGELIAAGHDPSRLAHPSYVRARPALDRIELFDASLFGIPAREARLIDPQHRLFLECCWEALERAGCDSETYPGSIGVYAGADLNTYLLHYFTNQALIEEAGALQIEVASDKEYLASRVSYKLDLRGPSIAVQTACSTSLVAVHLACQGLLSGECDMALAGGASVQVPQISGYYALEGAIHSRDGHCRAFDARAQGTVFGSGVGTVVLKRLTDALADGDVVRAVIKGSAVNNDGSRKVGFTAPSGEGQARVIRAAQIVAEVDPDTITYVEAHGTGTALGDPIEVAALTQAFRATTALRGFCGIGSVKTNFGHLKSAAGIAGLIKTVLCLEHRMLPPLLHLERPNPHIDFANSPFFPVDRLREWKPAEGAPLRAAVSSFGVGGTNAHVIVEEAPPQEPSGPSRPWQVLPLSAASASALERVRKRLAQHLRDHPVLSPADAAWTLQVGRRAGRHRAFVVSASLADAVDALESPGRVQTAVRELRDRPVAFLFPGQGAQHPGMARDLYATEPAFRAHLDRCCEILRPRLGLDLREALFPAPGEEEEAASRLEQTALAQPALFAVEHSLARLLMEWGIQPRAMLGHSLGEYVAACLAGVFSLEDALALVAERGRLMQELPAGAILSVPLPEEELRPRLGAGLALAAVNGPGRCAVSGEESEVAALEAELAAAGIAVRRLHTSHAFHSPMMEPAAAAFAERVRAVRREAPAILFLSNLTGTWITAGQATDPAYWARHLLETVRFGDGLRTLVADEKTVLLEVGPGQTLSAFARRSSPRQAVVTSLPHPKDGGSAAEHLMGAVGRLWLAGAPVDWRAFHAHEQRRRVELPTYPFERQRYWVDATPSPAVRPAVRRTIADIADWFQVPAWKPSLPPEEPASAAGRWLLLTPGAGLGAAVERRLAALGGTVVVAEAGEAFAETAPGRFVLRPGGRDSWAALFARLRETGALPERVLHLWGLGDADEDRCFWSLLWLGQELGRLGLPNVQLRVVTDGLCSVAGEPVSPEKALALGPVRVLPLEHLEIGCTAIDVAGPALPDVLADRLIAEALSPAAEPVVAWRGEERRVEAFEPLRIAAAGRLPFPERGVCLVTGGLGGLGLTLARELARSFRARLVLTGRSARERDFGAVRELEELGAEVLVLAADVTDEAAMREVVRQARGRFGPIQAAIHAAGVPGGGVIQLKTAEAAARVLAPKVRGTRVLAAALASEPLEILVFCSSTFAITGGIGQVDYCAANSFLDAFARQAAQRGVRAISLNWGAWQGVGMAVEAAARYPAGERSPESVQPAAPPLHPLLDRRLEPGVYATNFSPGLIRPEEGIEAFRRALSRGRFCQVAISPIDPRAAVAAAQRQTPETGTAPTAPSFSRPSLATAYVAPSTEAETVLTEVWQRVLGFDQIGVHDNFFDLGGDSVVAIQVIAQSMARGLSLTPEQLFEHQTIAALARLVAAPAPFAGFSAAADLPPETLKRLLAGREDLAASVEDLYRLSPIQEGMLFHALHGGEVAPYFEQVVFTYDRELDLDRLERAWQQAIERHPALRTAFVWQEVERPVQIVHRRAELACAQQDWRSLVLPEREARLRCFLAEDRARGFALNRAPLLRLTAIRWDDATWRLVWSYHHLVLDGWSVEMLLREVAALYAAADKPAAAALEPRRPFRDYIAWLRQQDLAAAEAWWRRIFAGFGEPTVLGIDRAPGRPILPGDVHAEAEEVLPAALSADLERFARRHRLTLHTVISGACALALARYADTEDVLYGSTVSGRPTALPGADSMIGCFINTLPVRVRTAPGQELLLWLQGLQAAQTELRGWEHSPLLEVRRWSGLPGDRPLFETILVFESMFQGGSESRQIHQRTNFPLTLVVWPGSEIALAAHFYTGRFAAEDISRLLGYIAELLQAFVTEPARLADLPLAPAHELAQVLREWNDTAEEAPAVLVHHLVASRAAIDPAAPAIADASLRLTYGELEERANRLARRLIRLGVGPEVLVGISLERSAEMVVALLAILKAGGAYLPLDPAYPLDRLRLMLEDSGARLLIAADGADELAPPGLRVLRVDDPAIATESARPPEVEVAPSQLAYIIYTSGSTGRPKGVQVSHGALANFLTAMRRRPGLAAEDALVATTSLSFDIAALEIYLPLLAGARLVVARREEVYDGGRLRELLAGQGATVVQGTPSTWRLLIESGWQGEPGFRVLCGGEALPEDLAAELLARAGEVWNLYGPTETTVWSAIERLAAGQPVSIGRPIANTAIYVVGSGFLPAPTAAPGELLIGGSGVARGYLGRPDLTAERFVPDPFGGAPGERLYRTGDLARHRPDGRLELLGRIDQQVKVRGFRIEPGEIEAVLLAHPGVARAVVVPSGRAGDAHLVACLVPRDGGGEASVAEGLVGEVRDALARQLPPYMMPSSWVVLPELPLTPNGKVDRRTLLAMRRPDRPAGARSEAPRSALERAIAAIWRELLGIEEVGVHDNFFDIGGHSLLMPRMQGRLREVLGHEVGIVELFRCSTIRSLAHHLAAGEEGEDPLAGIERQESRAERGRSRLRQLREERRSVDV